MTGTLRHGEQENCDQVLVGLPHDNSVFSVMLGLHPPLIPLPAFYSAGGNSSPGLVQALSMKQLPENVTKGYS